MPSRRAFLSGHLSPPRPDATGPRIARVGPACLPLTGVDCGSCADACPDAAIRLRPRAGGPPLPALSAAACTGCGDCLTVCPVAAIDLVPEDAHA